VPLEKVGGIHEEAVMFRYNEYDDGSSVESVEE
jgi:hypothetical protein